MSWLNLGLVLISLLEFVKSQALLGGTFNIFGCSVNCATVLNNPTTYILDRADVFTQSRAELIYVRPGRSDSVRIVFNRPNSIQTFAHCSANVVSGRT
jgi:hypothetical protein